MTCYIVTFEPIPFTVAGRIRERLQTLQNYCPINAYCWAVLSDMDPVALANYISVGSENARIFVIRSGTLAAWRNSYGEKNTEWLKRNL